MCVSIVLRLLHDILSLVATATVATDITIVSRAFRCRDCPSSCDDHCACQQLLPKIDMINSQSMEDWIALALPSPTDSRA